MSKLVRGAVQGGALPPVSVLIAVYNHAPYLRECLDSILATSYPVMELIITNDASPDTSDAVIRAWLDEHPGLDVTYVLNPQNIGLTKSLNHAVKRAKYDILCMFAGDDIMLPGSIVERVRYLQENPMKLAVFADCHVIDETGRLMYRSGIEDFQRHVGMRKRYLHDDRSLLYSIVFNWSVPGPVFLCKKAFFEAVGFYDEELLVEDWDMYIRGALAGKLGFLDAYVANYRVHSASMMRQHAHTNYLLPSIEQTLEKNTARTRGLARYRLIALRKAIAYDSAQLLPERARLWLLHKALLALTNWAYRLHLRRAGVHASLRS